MKTILKRLSACAVAAAAAVGLAAPAWGAVTLPDLPAGQCVVDDANVLSEDTTAYMEQLNGLLEANCSGAQIGVLTVQYTGNASTEEYATQAINTWGVGSASENNGILILLVMESPLYADGDYYLTYGDGFRNTTIDRQASTLSQTMEDDFAAKDYDAAVRTCADAVASAVAGVYGVDLTSGQPAGPAPSGGMNLGVFVLVAVLAVVMLILVFGNVLGNAFPFCLGWCLGSNFGGPRGPRPPRPGPPPPRPPRPPRGPRGPYGGGFGGFGGGGFGGGGFGGGGFGGMGGGSSHGGGGGRGR